MKYGRRGGLALIAAAVLLSELAVPAAHAATGVVTQIHVRRHLRVDGSSDLRGTVHARSGLKVTNGISTDTIAATGPAQVGGTLTVTGAVQMAGSLTVSGQVSTNGLNAGGGNVATAGALQGGILTVSGDANLGGNVQVGKKLTAASAVVDGGLHVGGALDASSASLTGALTAQSVNSGGSITAGTLSVGGPLAASSATVNGGLSAGAITAGSVSTSGAVTAGTGTFTHLALAQGGTVNFGNASITTSSGMNVSGAMTAGTLQLQPQGFGGSNGVQALTITQGSQTASLSVDSSGNLNVSGNGLTTQALNITGTGALAVSRIASTTSIQLSAPTVTTSSDLAVGPAGNLRLDTATSAGSPHIMGNHDTRGQCTASAVAGTTNTCLVSFSNAYRFPPYAVVTPTNVDPSTVTGLSVSTTSTGITISFTVAHSGSVSFNYMVEG